MKLTKETAARMNRISVESEMVRVLRKHLIEHLQAELQNGEEKGNYDITNPELVFSVVGAETVLDSVIDDFYSSISREGHTSSQVEFLRAYAVQPTKEGTRRRFAEGDSI